VRSVTAVPALAFVTGVGAGVSTSLPAVHLWFVLSALLIAGAVALLWPIAPSRRRYPLAAVCVVAGLLHGTTAREAAFHSSLRVRLDSIVGGASIDDEGVIGRHEPFRLQAMLTEDASDAGEFVSLRLASRALLVRGEWLPVSGGLVVSVNGSVGRERRRDWSAGRIIEAAVSFRRPARYLNDGVADFERDAALDGITLFGSVKSPLLVDVVARGSWPAEAAASARRVVRRAIARSVAPHGAVPAAIVTAVLIGDRAGLPDQVRTRLQAAGTYHVIAISGGNIAILAALIVAICAVFGVHGRYVAIAAIVVLLMYAQVATAGPSVWRATLMATLYFGARILDHRTPPWHAVAVTAAVIAVIQPLDVRNAGFLLTFGATSGLLAIASIGSTRRVPRAVAWLLASVTASLAAEIVLLPVSATVFSRVTAAGLLLNLIAVPAMAVVQIAGMVVVAVQPLDALASAAGWLAAHGATVLVESARLVDLAPWIVRRVPPPPFWLVAIYYVALATAWTYWRTRRGVGAALVMAAVAGLMVTGIDPLARSTALDVLRLTMIDVGQGDSMLLEAPAAPSLLVDTGGAPFGSGSFDIGERVLAPALWARGVRRLGDLLITHGDPDHLGGAPAVLTDFRPVLVWWGIPVPRHGPSTTFLDAARAASRLEYQRAGETIAFGRVRLRVLNPPEADWERQRVRNDDSVVLEVIDGDVALLLAGDISADVERAIVPQLTPARLRILKVAHHGSRTSSSTELLESWRPQIALISCGRGNTFGHPAPEVIVRLQSIGARIYRTDRDGEITLTSDGRKVQVRTFTGGKE
jgi:competence protein ComEC